MPLKARLGETERETGLCLHREIARLTPAAQRRQAWFAADALSSQWVSSWPQRGLVLSREEFREVFTTYLGLESPSVRPYAQLGWHVPCSVTGGARRLCDAYGLELGLATLPGTTHTKCHDACLREVVRILRESGIEVMLEPRTIFNNLIPTWVLDCRGHKPAIV